MAGMIIPLQLGAAAMTVMGQVRAGAHSNAMAKANAAKSKVRAHVEHVFAQQKDRMGLVIRNVGLKRAEAKIGLANLTYNLQRYLFHERRTAQAA